MLSSRALRSEFGPVVPRLPAVTAGRLPPRLLRQFQSFTSAVAQVFAADPSPLAMIRASQRLFPGASVAIYPSVHRGALRWMLHNFYGEPSSGLVRNSTFLPSVSRYRARGDDPFANRAVNLPTLFALWDAERSPTFDFAYSTVLEPNGLHHQLRAVLYDDHNEATFYVGFFRGRTHAPFSVDEHVLLQLALPVFLDWFHVVRAIGLHPLGDHALATALDTNPLPCWLLDGARIVFANLAARALELTPPWVVRPTPSAPARRTALSPGGHPLTLVVSRDLGTPGDPAHLGGLSPSLREVAALAASGQSDKEIALALGKPVATVRTYLARVYARLGIHGRRELMRGGSW